MKPFNERINSSFIKKANNKRPLLTVNRQNIPKNKQIRKNFTKHITFCCSKCRLVKEFHKTLKKKIYKVINHVLKPKHICSAQR